MACKAIALPTELPAHYDCFGFIGKRSTVFLLKIQLLTLGLRESNNHPSILWQEKIDSNNHYRFWRPGFYRWTIFLWWAVSGHQPIKWMCYGQTFSTTLFNVLKNKETRRNDFFHGCTCSITNRAIYGGCLNCQNQCFLFNRMKLLRFLYWGLLDLNQHLQEKYLDVVTTYD